MDFMDQFKSIAEVITTTATAVVVITHLFKYLFKVCDPIKIFFKITVPLFFKGTKNLEGKKVWGLKALELRHKTTANILKAVAPDCEMEEVLVLNKKALLKIISESGAFYPVSLRKK